MKKEKYITPDIIEIKILENYKIFIKFKTNEEKVYDMKNLINKIEFFNKLKDLNYFKKATIRGDTIEWPNGEDVAPENLYYDSIAIDKK